MRFHRWRPRVEPDIAFRAGLLTAVRAHVPRVAVATADGSITFCQTWQDFCVFVHLRSRTRTPQGPRALAVRADAGFFVNVLWNRLRAGGVE